MSKASSNYNFVNSGKADEHILYMVQENRWLTRTRWLCSWGGTNAFKSENFTIFERIGNAIAGFFSNLKYTPARAAAEAEREFYCIPKSTFQKIYIERAKLPVGDLHSL